MMQSVEAAPEYQHVHPSGASRAGTKRVLPADSNSSKTGTGAMTSAVEWSAGSPCTSQATTRRGRKRRRASLNEQSTLDLEFAKPTAMVVSSLGVEGEGSVRSPSTVTSLSERGGLLQLPLPRCEAVRQVERRVANMFRELDLLLQAEKINRRVMYRWSGADKSCVPLDEGNTGYCTWGRELVKQAVEDAIGDIRKVLTSAPQELTSCAEAGRRLIQLYVNKASERLIPENERPLHDEVMSNIGNLWFWLLPRISQEEKEQFQRLVTRIAKTGGLVAAFRCALEFSRVNFNGEEASEEEGVSEERLSRLLCSDDVYRCDAYVCLWEVAEALARSGAARPLWQEFRLKALDSEMWRAMLLEEQESRHKTEEMEDEWDDEEEDEEEEETGEEGMAALEEDEEQAEDDKPAMDEEDDEEEAGSHVAAGEPEEEKEVLVGAGMLGVVLGRDGAAVQQADAPAPQEAKGAASSDVALPMKPAALSRYSSMRRSSQGQPGHAERWASKAALEGPEQEMYVDYLGRRQHEYRRAVTPEFCAKVQTFLQDCQPATDSQPTTEEGAVDGDALLLNRARPFLFRMATVLSTEDLPAYLDLLASRLGYESTLMLLEPIMIDEREDYSSTRVSAVLSWAVSFEQGEHLAAFLDRYLSRLNSRTELRHLALQAVAFGPASFPLLDRALAQVPRQDYDNVAVELCRRAASCWHEKGWGAYMMVLRVLQRLPSLRLYLRCRAHFNEPVAKLLRPIMQFMDPCGELSIGIRLVEGMVASAVASIARSLELLPPASATPISRKDRAQRWLDFAFAGVRGGQFPPCLIEKLCEHPTFVPMALGPAQAADGEFLQAMVTLLGRLTELAHSHPRVVALPCRLILCHYESLTKAGSCAMDASVLAAGEGILRAVGELALQA